MLRSRRSIPFLILAIGVAAAIQLPGQELTDDTAVLISGPERRRGIPFLPPNDLVHWIAEYEFRGRTIRVAVIDAGAADGLAGVWAPYPCPELALQQHESRAGTVVRTQQALTAGPAGLVALVPQDADLCSFFVEFDAAAAFFTEAVGARGPNDPPIVVPAYVQVGS